MRLIDADAFLVDSIKEECFVFYTDDLINNERIVKTVFSGLAEALNNAPTVDAEPVRHGHWVEIEESETGHLMECSICNNWIFHNFNYVSKYCPDCGSKMDLE